MEVLGRRAARGILEFSLNYGVNHESNIEIIGRGGFKNIDREGQDRLSRECETRL